MSKVISDYKLYRVKKSKAPIEVGVRVLHSQVGATAVRIGTRTPLNDDADGDPDRWKSEWRFSPGTGQEVAGKLLFITTAVTDVRKETDKTGVSYQFAGGVDSFNCTLEAAVDEAGGVVIYQLTVDFYA